MTWTRTFSGRSFLVLCMGFSFRVIPTILPEGEAGGLFDIPPTRVYSYESPKPRRLPMSEIRWLRDADAALAEAKAARKPILLDFSAAPM